MPTSTTKNTNLQSLIDDFLADSDDDAPPAFPHLPPRTTFKQPFLESYFPPLSASGLPPPEPPHQASSLTSVRSGRKGKNKTNRSTSSSSRRVPAADEENLETAILLKNRDLEIYVTLPSAEKRLFVDVQEEIHLPHGSQDTSSRKTKRLKTDHAAPHQKSSKKVTFPPSQPAPLPAVASSSSTSSAKTVSTRLPSFRADETGKTVSEKSTKSISAPLSSKDPNSSSSQPAKATSANTTSSEPKKTAITTSSLSKSKKEDGALRLPYATFEQVKLNVRVKPPSSSKEPEKGRHSSTGVEVAALPKQIIQPKVINRFPIRILGSTTRPTASAALQDTFDLSVQGCTEISSLLVLLYTRIKLSHEDSNFGSAELHLNAIRLWHLDEDRLVRLSNGTIASNEITPKSILCYTIGKRTGKSFVHTYVDESKVSRVEVDIELSRPWQSKEQDEGLEERKRPEAPRRQLLKFKHDLPKTRGFDNLNSSSNKAPYHTSFSISLIGEMSNSPTPMEIAREQARTEHYEKRRLKQERREERRKEIVRLEAHRKRLQKNKKTTTQIANVADNLQENGFVAVHAVPGGGSTDIHAEENQAALAAKRDVQDSSDESDWCSDAFEDDWDATHPMLSDECDDALPFLPCSDKVEMTDSVLLSTTTRSMMAPALPSKNYGGPSGDVGQNVLPSVPTVREGLEHILMSLGIPKSSSEPFIQNMVKATAVYPYIAVMLIDYESVAFAMNLDAKYRPVDEEGTFWDIKDIEQVCLVYKGIWKSEVEDWKRGSRSLTGIDWSNLARYGNINMALRTPLPAPVPAPGLATSTTTHASAQSTRDAVGASSNPVTPEQRFDDYRMRTQHRRCRDCPVCNESTCYHSRHLGDDCDACVGADPEEDDFFKYYLDQEQENDSPASSGASSSVTGSEASALDETVASVMVPGHRARVIQCIFMEAF